MCEDCKEDFGIKNQENNTSKLCAICSWPINRKISKEKVKEFCRGIIKWLKKQKPRNFKKIVKKIETLNGKDAELCRYDFFYLIRDFIKEYDARVAKKYEKEIASKFDFGGALVS